MEILQKMRLSEALSLDISVGDTVLMGKFKNKKVVVKDIGYDDLGQLTINGKKALTFRIAKLMPKKEKEDAKNS